MKTNLRYLIISLLLGVSAVTNGQFVAIPDANFRTWLNNNGYASCMSGNNLDTTCSVVVNATKVNCSNQNISNLTGIQYFDNLDTLLCMNNNLTSFPGFHASLLYQPVAYE